MSKGQIKENSYHEDSFVAENCGEGSCLGCNYSEVFVRYTKSQGAIVLSEILWGSYPGENYLRVIVRGAIILEKISSDAIVRGQLSRRKLFRSIWPGNKGLGGNYPGSCQRGQLSGGSCPGEKCPDNGSSSLYLECFDKIIVFE